MKVHHKENQTYLIQYVLDTNQELNWLVTSKDVEVFYDSSFDFMAADLQIGVINL